MLQQTYLRGRGVSVCCAGAYTQVNFYPIFKEKTIVLVTVDKTTNPNNSPQRSDFVSFHVCEDQTGYRVL